MQKPRDINFGEIDHFLYVRISCICADLEYIFKDFIEQSYCLLVDLIDEAGRTHFERLNEEFKKYADYRERTRYAPRMIEKVHSFVVGGIHEEIYDHLKIIKDENKFPWIVVLRVLLMAMEAEMDEMDETAWKDGQMKRFVIDEFLERRTSPTALSKASCPLLKDDTYQIEKTDKCYEYERKKGFYKEGVVEMKKV